MFSLFFVTVLFAAEHVHQHGHVNVDIAFEANQGKIEIETPSDTLFGFEYKPKTLEQKKRVAEKTTEVETSIGKMIVFDPALACQIQKEKTERKAEGKNHSEMHFSFSVSCAKSPVGTTVVFNMQSVLPMAKDVDVQFIADAVQKSVEANKNGIKLELK